MITMLWRKVEKMSPVKINPVIMDQVGILLRLPSACPKINLARLFIHMSNTADYPFSFCDLVF